MHYSINPEEIKAKIEKLGHTVSNISNMKQYKTKLPLSMFFVELKQPQIMTYMKLNIYNCKIKFEPRKHKRNIAQCAVKDMGTQELLRP
jgi:hypothetical protein